MTMIEISDTRNELISTLHAASHWILESNDDLQELANEIAEVSPSMRVTFLRSNGIVLADSTKESAKLGNHINRPEIVDAFSGDTIGVSLRLSETMDTLMLYAAQRISPQLILRLGYPVQELTHWLVVYGGAVAFLILVLFFVQRAMLSRFAKSMIRQMNDISSMLEGTIPQPQAVFSELQPTLNSIAYQIERLNLDYKESVETANLRKDFVVNASHELRSPLTSIMGFAEMLDEGMVDSPEEHSLCIQTIRSECQRMLAVIEDILHLSKAELQTTEAETMDIRPVADEVCQALSHRAVQKQIVLRVEGQSRMKVTEKDVWEVIYNLTDNAIRYGRDGGKVTIRLDDRKIVVEDDGIGIEKQHLPRIFEQFYRVDETRDNSVHGTGLGLSIVRAIARRYGGDVQVESEIGKSSRFIVTFADENNAA